jgi:hypothetical protein
MGGSGPDGGGRGGEISHDRTAGIDRGGVRTERKKRRPNFCLGRPKTLVSFCSRSTPAQAPSRTHPRSYLTHHPWQRHPPPSCRPAWLHPHQRPATRPRLPFAVPVVLLSPPLGHRRPAAPPRSPCRTLTTTVSPPLHPNLNSVLQSLLSQPICPAI